MAGDNKHIAHLKLCLHCWIIDKYIIQKKQINIIYVHTLLHLYTKNCQPKIDPAGQKTSVCFLIMLKETGLLSII